MVIKKRNFVDIGKISGRYREEIGKRSGKYQEISGRYRVVQTIGDVLWWSGENFGLFEVQFLYRKITKSTKELSENLKIGHYFCNFIRIFFL